jgi:multidrug resistance efflux pump
MAMKFYSEQLKKLFDTPEELLAAEEKVNAAKRAEEEKKAQLKAQREQRAKEVEDAFKFAAEAQKRANELLNAFVKDYGSYPTAFTDTLASIWDAFNLF